MTRSLVERGLEYWRCEVERLGIEVGQRKGQ